MVKRTLDYVIAFAMLVVLSPLILLISAIIALIDGRPIFFCGERMKSPSKAFRLIKFRTMFSSANDSGVTGGEKAERVTKLGKILRKKRLDELPQLINVLLGDMSLVGPRPPLRRYVQMFPELYSAVLQVKPGITGLASIMITDYEYHILSQSKTVEDTEELYCKRCIPKKAKLDMIYAERQNTCWDIKILLLTVTKIFQ